MPALTVATESSMLGADRLTVILRVAVLLPLTLLAVIVYTTLVAALAGVPEIVPSVVSKDRALSIAGDIEYVASPPEFVTVILLMALLAVAVIVVVERLIFGAAGLTVILRVAVLLPLTLLAVIVYTTLVAALAGVPEIVPSVVSKDRPLSIAGDIEYVASPPEFVTVILLMALLAVAVIVVVERLIIGAGGLTVISMVAESVPVTLLAVTVYVATVTAVGVPEIVPSVVSKDKLLAIVGAIEYKSATPPVFVALISTYIPTTAVTVAGKNAIFGAAGLTVMLRVAESLLVTLLAVIVYTCSVAVALGVPEIVPVLVAKERPSLSSGEIE